MNPTIETKLKALYKIQTIDSELDKLSAVRGDLPLEVADLEDDITGLNTRLDNIKQALTDLDEHIKQNKAAVKDKEKTIVKYKEQLNDVRNNREFEALSKEIEIMELEILTLEKASKEAYNSIEIKNEMLEKTAADLDSRKKDLEFKQKELEVIVKETQEEETKLDGERAAAFSELENRLQVAYARIRSNVKNGIAVAPILRGSCGGCFAKIPPQRQSDIRQHLRIIDCENCGRIIVDSAISGLDAEIIEEPKATPKRRGKLGSIGAAK